ncbi:hypothetical protein LIA77_00613 [Sarocladium implicatum]|nr:hypothetical protein LIA77_00613 [Sarocladium implicatum]
MKNPAFFATSTLSTVTTYPAKMDNKSAYQSFHEIELYEPKSPPRRTNTHPTSMCIDGDRPFSAGRIQRQDSGYESYTTSPRTSTSQSRPPLAARRISNASATASHGVSTRPRTGRPSTRRSNSHNPWTATPVHAIRPTEMKQANTYFHFPSPDPVELTAPAAPSSETPAPLPPQTTHYWTSDSTRRLEYAAIDASCRGVKGWVKRNLVPGCFTAKEDRHVAFDDDTGSVRRYRLDLEPEEKAVPFSAPCRRKGWQFWGESSHGGR